MPIQAIHAQFVLPAKIISAKGVWTKGGNPCQKVQAKRAFLLSDYKKLPSTPSLRGITFPKRDKK